MLDALSVLPLDQCSGRSLPTENDSPSPLAAAFERVPVFDDVPYLHEQFSFLFARITFGALEAVFVGCIRASSKL